MTKSKSITCKEKGFTLIEGLITVAIVLVIWTTAFPLFYNTSLLGKSSQGSMIMMNDLAMVAGKMQSYPKEELNTTMPSTVTCDGQSGECTQSPGIVGSALYGGSKLSNETITYVYPNLVMPGGTPPINDSLWVELQGAWTGEGRNHTAVLKFAVE